MQYRYCSDLTSLINSNHDKEEAIQLRKENQELLRVALARIEELEKQKTPPPAFVKADVQKPAAEEKKPCKRAVKGNMRCDRLRPPGRFYSSGDHLVLAKAVLLGDSDSVLGHPGLQSMTCAWLFSEARPSCRKNRCSFFFRADSTGLEFASRTASRWVNHPWRSTHPRA